MYLVLQIPKRIQTAWYTKLVAEIVSDMNEPEYFPSSGLIRLHLKDGRLIDLHSGRTNTLHVVQWTGEGCKEIAKALVNTNAAELKKVLGL